jgi:hypothetical protein
VGATAFDVSMLLELGLLRVSLVVVNAAWTRCFFLELFCLLASAAKVLSMSRKARQGKVR